MDKKAKKKLEKKLKKVEKRLRKKTRFQRILEKLTSPFKKVYHKLKNFHLPHIPWKTGLFTFLLGSDLLAKKFVDETMVPGQTKEYFGGNLKIRQVYNQGFMLNKLDDKPEIVKNTSLGIAGFLTLYNTWLMSHKGHLIKKLGMVFMNAGAVSNIFDRLFRGKVVDYIGIKSENKFLSSITANLADLYVLIGSVFTTIGR
ncbi:MAG: signal peptidase II [Dorea sp.]|nr:signal peptidase II [Dorea sp.]